MNNRFDNAPLDWVTTLIFSITGLGALILVPLYGLYHDYSTAAWVTCLVLFCLGGLSITLGYHRLWSHRAFEAHWSVRLACATFGAMTLQNSIMHWASDHRRHHRYVDDDDLDPYSAGRGFWFSHMGWMLHDYPSAHDDFSNIPDIQRDPIAVWQHNNYLAIAITTNIAIPLGVGVAVGDILGTLLLAGLLRLVANHHTTFFINSWAHMWGTQPYTDSNSARDNHLLAFFTFGEGYHNYHHYFQADYRNGIQWWQWDPTKWTIAGLSRLGLTWNLKTTPSVKIQRAILDMQFRQAENKLRHAPFGESWRTVLEREADAFRHLVAEWKRLQGLRFDNARSRLSNAWNHVDLNTHLKEIEVRMKLQRKRLAVLMKQCEMAPVTVT
jgi:stearoyl-CoA desaturase (delta-9 desaturase)